MLIYAKNKLVPQTQPCAGSVWTGTQVETLSVEDQLRAVKTPEKTDTHTPIPHSLLVAKTRKALDRAGFSITEEEHALARGGQRYFGGFALTGDDIKGEDRRLVFGLRNSSDKSVAASACMGNQMLVCDNMCFSSDVKLSRRHTVNILRDLDGMLANAISRIVSHWHDMGQRIEAYKETEISKERASNLVVDLAEIKAFPERDVYSAVKEFRAPRHPEFKDNSLWSLYNSVTENLKGGDLSKLPERTMKMQSIFDRVAGHTPVIEAVEVEESEAVVLPA
tara:strand:- start:37 stop:873 length:837 start_codon:yes stop_codon:yes gene_type:complete